MTTMDSYPAARAAARTVRAGLAILVAILPCACGQDPGPKVLSETPTRALLLDLATPPGLDAPRLAVGEHGRILRAEESRGWQLVPTPTDRMLTAVHLADADHGWAVGHDATILATENGGRTWTEQYSDPEAEAPFLDVWFEDLRHGLAIGAYGLACETFDGGSTWESRDIAPEGPHLYGIVESPAGSLYVAGEFGTFLRSGDRGETWSELETPYGGTYFGLLALSDGAILTFGLRGNVFRSEDEGATWTRVPIYQRESDEAPWQSAETGTFASVLCGMESSETGTVLLAGAAGTLLWSRDRGRTFIALAGSERRAITSLAQIDGDFTSLTESGIQDSWVLVPPATWPGEEERP